MEPEIVLFKGAYDVRLKRLNYKNVKGFHMLYFIDYIPTEEDIQSVKRRNYANGLVYWNMIESYLNEMPYDSWSPFPYKIEKPFFDAFAKIHLKIGKDVPYEDMAFKTRTFVLNDKGKSQMYTFGLLCGYIKNDENKGICSVGLVMTDYQSPEDFLKEKKEFNTNKAF
jgi:hypothetical protein